MSATRSAASRLAMMASCLHFSPLNTFLDLGIACGFRHQMIYERLRTALGSEFEHARALHTSNGGNTSNAGAILPRIHARPPLRAALYLLNNDVMDMHVCGGGSVAESLGGRDCCRTATQPVPARILNACVSVHTPRTKFCSGACARETEEEMRMTDTDLHNRKL